MELGKKIVLKIEGEDTELDKSMIEQINDPLMHLVRNGIDHGIENSGERLAAGKPEEGSLVLRSYHDSGSVVIEVEGDGKGLDRDRIVEKAVANGLIRSTEGMTDHDIYQLIFSAGFSTAEVVTDLSGRGVGMDVVRRNIENLRGQIDLDSRPGEGSRISIRLPLTLAIIDGFTIAVGSNRYILPLDTVVECIELENGLQRDSDYVDLRGEILPILRLRDFFHQKAVDDHGESVVVVEYGGERAGIVVDELLGEFQTVVKPMSKVFGNVTWISGSTILGDGAVAVILDVAGVIKLVVSRCEKRLGNGLKSA